MREINSIIYSPYEPPHKKSLWIKPNLTNDTNRLFIYNNGWESINIGGSGEGGTSNYEDLQNLPKINNVTLKGNLTLSQLGIKIPDVSGFITKTDADRSYLPIDASFKTVNGISVKGTGNITIDIPDTSDFITAEYVDTKVQDSLSSLTFKTINGQEITGEGNIEIEGGENITVDTELNANSKNPVANSTLTSIINKINKELFPLTLTATGGGVFEKGTTQNVVISWVLNEGDTIVYPDQLGMESPGIDILPPSTTSKSYQITETTIFKVWASKNGTVLRASTTATFVNASYYGSVADDFTPTEEGIKALTKRVSASNIFTTTFTSLDNQKSCFAYPKSFGALTSIKDANNFDYIDSYTRSELTVNDETYYVYVLTDSTTITNFKQVYA